MTILASQAELLAVSNGAASKPYGPIDRGNCELVDRPSVHPRTPNPASHRG